MRNQKSQHLQKIVVVLIAVLFGCVAIINWFGYRAQEKLDLAITRLLLQSNSTSPIKLREVLSSSRGVVCAVQEDDSFSPELSTMPEMQRLAKSKPLGWVEERAYGTWTLSWTAPGKSPQAAYIAQRDLRLLRPVDYRRLLGPTAGDAPLCASLTNAQLVRVWSAGRAFVVLQQEGEL